MASLRSMQLAGILPLRSSSTENANRRAAEEDIDLACRAPEPDATDAVATVHSADLWSLQEASEPSGGRQPVCQPAMALGVTDHIWTIGELIGAATSDRPVAPAPMQDRPPPGSRWREALSQYVASESVLLCYHRAMADTTYNLNGGFKPT